MCVNKTASKKNGYPKSWCTLIAGNLMQCTSTVFCTVFVN